MLMNIRPVSDLRNRYAEIERDVAEKGPVFLTKNGYGRMVAMSVDQCGRWSGTVEAAPAAAARQAATTSQRYTHDEVFSSIRRGLRDEPAAAAM